MLFGRIVKAHFPHPACEEMQGAQRDEPGG
jgi:hypothetical protein